MWRPTGDFSLFPSARGRKSEDVFEFLGTVVARALLEERLIELPFSHVFWRLVRGEVSEACCHL